MTQQLIVDTDAGIDDAIALLMALAAPNCEIAAITTVSGNVSVDQVTRNVSVILDAAKASRIPVFVGADRPILGPAMHAEYFHGEDGLGDAGFTSSPRQPENEHAVTALVRLAREHPGVYTLVAMGPLTNVALALALEPQLPQLLCTSIIMGGAVRARGNTTAVAEFNTYADPEAAAMVFERGLHPTVLPWETTVETPVPWDTWQRLIQAGPIGRSFVEPMMSHATRRSRDERKTPGILLPDPLAMAVALDPTCGRTYNGHVAVEISGRVARGLMAVDAHGVTGNQANATIIDYVNSERFIAMLARAMGEVRNRS